MHYWQEASGEAQEKARRSAVSRFHLDSEGRDPEFDAVTELAADLFDVPVALVTVLSGDRQLFRGACGIDQSGTSRDVAFCNFTVQQDEVFIVEDASIDPRVRDNPMVTGEPHVRFYAGAPIKIGQDIAVGAMCLVDYEPRKFSQRDSERLKRLAQTVADLITLRVGSLEAKKRKETLQQQTELLRATIDHVQQGIGVFDADLNLVLWNELLFELLQLPQEMCQVGCRAEDMLLAAARAGTFGSGDAQQIVSALVQSIRTTPSRRLDLHLPDGRILDAWRAAISDGRSILTIQDVTEQRRTVRMQDEFVSTVSHELRTPLTSIRGALAILGHDAQAKLDARGQQMLAMATKNADRLTALINDILDIERLGSGSLAMSHDPIDLTRILSDAVEQNRPFAAAHGVQLDLENAPGELTVIGDAGRLLQAMTNLISNASKYSPRGETVRVVGMEEAGHAVLKVEDRGPGIPVEFRPHIFGRFAQAGPEHQQGRPGSGLGLAITQAIIERHRGTIGFDTEVGTGSCFWIRLPLARSAA